MKSEPINIETFTINDIVELTGVRMAIVKNKLKSLLEEEKLHKDIKFTKRQIFQAGLTDAKINLQKGMEEINHRLECLRTVLKSQERAKRIFDSSLGIRHIKFPNLRIYEKILSDNDITRIKASWARKHVFHYGVKTLAYKNYLEEKELASYMK